MKKDKIRAHCPRCRHRQPFLREKVNHPLHLLLTILTGGLWLISWIALAIGRLRYPWRCEHCGWHSPVFGKPEYHTPGPIAGLGLGKGAKSKKRWLSRPPLGDDLSPVKTTRLNS
jgi:hypothetical protein